MATGTANSTQPPPATGAGGPGGGGPTGGYGESVQRQLRQTQRQVKFVDLCTALMGLAAVVVGFLLLVAVIDHWVIGLGFFGRLLALMVLLGGCGWHVATVVLPLMIHQINPLYAARSIELGTPALKNSLINFLMFRSNQASIHRVVYQAMEQKAATDLASVPVDTAVDRSKMIKVGYVLAGVSALGAAYTILSPKDPFQTLARVAMPWQSIARPSRVVIEDVQPGTIEAVQGRFVEVTARLHGVRDDKETVSLIYSTHDGQTVERHVTMRPDENGLTYHGQLPAETDGLQQDLEYRVESGDAISETYAITLSPVASILVDSVEYEYPRYTNRSAETVQRDGNIRGLEGTRVTIVATANKPIRSAAITFNPFQAADAEQPPLRREVQFQDRTVRETFTLALAGDRRTPVLGSYQLSFETKDGATSQQPILHQIDVVPDLAPEVEILVPTQHRIAIPLSSHGKIEVRAIDPDFGLSRLTLRAVAGGADVLDKTLFEDVLGRRGQAIEAYDFAPSALGLVVGDKVTYWAVAADNRTSVDGQQAAANVARTRQYQIEVVPDPPRRGNPAKTGEPEAGQPKAPNDDPAARLEPNEKDEDSPSEKPKDGDNPPPEGAGDDPKSPSDPSDEKPEEDPETKDGKTEEGAGVESGSSSNSPEGEPQEGGGAGQPQDGQSQPGDGESAGGNGGSTPQSGGQPDGASGGQGGDSPPQDLHDGEVFEKVLRKMQEEQAEGQGRQDPNGNGGGDEPPPGNNSENPGEGQPSDKPSGQANDQSKPQGGATGDSQGSDSNSQPFSEDGQPQPNSPESGKPQAGEGAQQPDRKRGAGSQKDGNAGEGGDTNDTSGEQQGKQKPDVPGEPDEREKEPGSGDNGESGAGQNSRDTEGTGSVESSQDQTVNNRDKPKNRNPDSTEPQQQDDPGATNSKKQSDSEGDQSGDQSGGGQKGPGQGANQAGNDSAGQNSSADDGAGASSEAGDGESSDAAGNKQEAPGKTGSSGNKKGPGSATRKDPNGNQESGTGSAPEAQPGNENRQPQDRQDGGGGGNRQGPSGVPAGGGVPSDVRHHSGLDPNLDVSEGDAANLEYSRKTTDMVIEYLKDQETHTDPELLDELGWTPDEMRKFIERWQRLKRSAADDTGRRELDESLKSLGLRSPESKLRQRRVKSDDQRGMSESGNQSEPPAGYRDLFKAFKKGAARVRD